MCYRNRLFYRSQLSDRFLLCNRGRVLDRPYLPDRSLLRYSVWLHDRP